MAWAGKLLGGLFGGMLGGPLGLGVGAALGHYLADSRDAERDRRLPLHLVRLEWQQHGFSASGPGVTLVPVWIARDREAVDCEVRVRVGGGTWRSTVTPEHPVEEVHAPSVFVPYARLEDPAEVEVRVRDGEGNEEAAAFRVPLPSPVRRLGQAGPARVVMAAVAAARAGGRALDEGAVAFIHDRFVEGLALDEAGEAWFDAWVDVLAEVEEARLSPVKVAERIRRHLEGPGPDAVLTLLMHGCRGAWPGEAGERWVDRFAAALGVSPADLSALWAAVDDAPDPVSRIRAAALLGVDADDPPEVVKAAWRRLVREAHPDRARDAAEVEAATRRTAQLNAAYRLLTRG